MNVCFVCLLLLTIVACESTDKKKNGLFGGMGGMFGGGGGGGGPFKIFDQMTKTVENAFETAMYMGGKFLGGIGAGLKTVGQDFMSTQKPPADGETTPATTTAAPPKA